MNLDAGRAATGAVAGLGNLGGMEAIEPPILHELHELQGLHLDHDHRRQGPLEKIGDAEDGCLGAEVVAVERRVLDTGDGANVAPLAIGDAPAVSAPPELLQQDVLCARSALRALAIIANGGRVRCGRRHVPTRNINLTAEQNEFVEKIVASGEYQNASEMIRDALRVLQRVRREDALKLKFLRTQIKAGTDALERGEFVEVHEADLDAYLDELGAPSLTRAR